MVTHDKIEVLRSITLEEKFRTTLLIPLFDKMGLTPVHTHGQNERGKDIVCNVKNNFNVIEWIAIAAKVGKITGSTSGSGSFQTVLNQIQEALIIVIKILLPRPNCLSIRLSSSQTMRSSRQQKKKLSIS